MWQWWSCCQAEAAETSHADCTGKACTPARQGLHAASGKVEGKCRTCFLHDALLISVAAHGLQWQFAGTSLRKAACNSFVCNHNPENSHSARCLSSKGAQLPVACRFNHKRGTRKTRTHCITVATPQNLSQLRVLLQATLHVQCTFQLLRC